MSRMPDESWSEDELITSLESTIGSSSVDAGHKRIKALDELEGREIKDENRVAGLLIEMAKKQGGSKPESDYIVKILSGIASSVDAVHEKLLAALEDEEMWLVYCTSKVIQNLDRGRKLRSVEPLVKALMGRNSTEQATNEIFKTLVSMGDEKINKKVLQLAHPHLDSANGFEVLYSVKISSELTDKSATPQLHKIVKRSLMGWYPSFNNDILTEISKFFQRVVDKKSLSYLLDILRKGPGPDAFKATTSALAGIADAYPETLDKIMKAPQLKGKEYLLLQILVKVEETRIDLNELFKRIPEDYLANASRANLKEIVIKQGGDSKPFLLEMLKSHKKSEYKFALDCLRETGISIDEMAGVFEEPLVLSVYNFFYERRKLSLEKIWEEQEIIGKNIKKAQINRFDFFIQNLFSTFGFITLYVDRSGMKGVDVVAFSSSDSHIFVIGCTTDVLKDDLQKIEETCGKMKLELKKLVERYTLTPVVFTAKNIQVHPEDSIYAKNHGIAILTSEDIENLLEMAKTGRSGKDVVEYVLNLRQQVQDA